MSWIYRGDQDLISELDLDSTKRKTCKNGNKHSWNRLTHPSKCISMKNLCRRCCCPIRIGWAWNAAKKRNWDLSADWNIHIRWSRWERRRYRRHTGKCNQSTESLNPISPCRWRRFSSPARAHRQSTKPYIVSWSCARSRDFLLQWQIWHTHNNSA